MSTELVSFSDLQGMARAVAASRFGGCETPEQAMTLMLIAQAEGRHPGIIVRDYHIIKGKPALKADAMLARFQEAGGVVSWHELSDARACATFSHPKGGEVTIDWDLERAKKAGLLDSNPNWKKYPRSQLRARVISESIRAVYPGVVCGTYTPEEMDDLEPRTPEYHVQPPASATAAQAAAAMATAQKLEASDDQKRAAFLDAIKAAGVRIGFERIIEVVNSHGYDDPETVQIKDYRPIINAIKELEAAPQN